MTETVLEERGKMDISVMRRGERRNLGSFLDVWK